MLVKIALALFILTTVIGVDAAQASSVKTTSKTPGRVTGSVYCVHGTVTVKGWEQDLVKRNPGLRRFNWTPITAAKPGVLVFRQPGQDQSSKQYHYAKPRVLSYAEMRAAQRVQEQRAQELKASQVTVGRLTNADLNGSLTSSGAGREANGHDMQNVQAQLVSTYTGASLIQPATFSSSYTASDNQRKVHGRLISSHY
jgi:hypothetical protein